ncbi:MAG TPA: sterol desaturase family protein [Vicinamibacteria bacterium]|nr:sterol desaturase family protein [Vicinamibacteria bacterium]
MSYLPWLVGITAGFFVVERLFPWRKGQPLARPGLLRDLGFLAVNGHLFSTLTAGLNGWVAMHATALLQRAGLRLDASPAGDWPLAGQLAALLVVSDLVQYATHVLLHRVPFLWTFHKVHHSITTMDFIGNFRFHWMEIVVYKATLWLPLAWLGASAQAAFVVAVVSTIWGDFNHSNLDVGLGRLGRVFNSPRMHLWHHDQSDEGGVAKNYGVVLSLWDHLFGTAYWPRDRSPAALGYPAMDDMPDTLLGQLLWPAIRRRAPAA